MRRADLDDAAGWFHPDVTWKGVPDDAVCRNRDDVIAMLRDSLTPCPEDPESYELDEELRGAEAIELIAASPGTVVLGAKVPGLTEIGGTDSPASSTTSSAFARAASRLLRITRCVRTHSRRQARRNQNGASTSSAPHDLHDP